MQGNPVVKRRSELQMLKEDISSKQKVDTPAQKRQKSQPKGGDFWDLL